MIFWRGGSPCIWIWSRAIPSRNAAAAYELLRKHQEDCELLAQALADAEPDGFVMPFVDSYRYLKPLLAQEIQGVLCERSWNWVKQRNSAKTALTAP